MLGDTYKLFITNDTNIIFIKLTVCIKWTICTILNENNRQI